MSAFVTPGAGLLRVAVSAPWSGRAICAYRPVASVAQSFPPRPIQSSMAQYPSQPPLSSVPSLTSEMSGNSDETIEPPEIPQPPISSATQTYTSCSKCDAAYEITAEDLGPSGTKVMCSVCNHTWFQRAEGLLEVPDEYALREYPIEKKAELMAAKAAARNEARNASRNERFGNRPQRGGDRPQRSGDRPQRSGDRPQRSGDRPQRDGDRPQSYGNRAQSYGDRTQSYGNRAQSYGDRTPSYGERRPARPHDGNSREFSRSGSYGPPRGEVRNGGPDRRSGGYTPRAGNGAFPLFIGNLPFSVTENDIEKLVRESGTVERVTLVHDTAGRSKGFAFADMATEQDAKNTIASLDGREVDGRPLTVRTGKKRNAP